MPLIGTEVCYNKSMSYKIERNDITRVRADAIVNTANPFPVIGKGTDTAVYEAAGRERIFFEAAIPLRSKLRLSLNASRLQFLRDGGNYHCYNVVPLPDGGECLFDLTSEQFGDEKLNYENNPEQFREVHFAKEEKHLRYNYLKAELLKKLEEM